MPLVESTPSCGALDPTISSGTTVAVHLKHAKHRASIYLISLCAPVLEKLSPHFGNSVYRFYLGLCFFS